MLRLNLKHVFNRRLFAAFANRYSERFQHDDAALKPAPLSPDKLPDTNSDKLLKNINTKELLDFSPPQPFEEVPVSEKVDEYHPADFIDHIGPPLPVSFNLAAYVNHSETLVKLVQLGVDLSNIDRYPEKANYVLRLDFERDCKKHIQFLHDHGVESDALGKFITKNPFIFREDLEDLEVRINYLESKKFSFDSIVKIITRNPAILNKSTKTVDKFLGSLQKQFCLSGDEVREVFTRCPKLIFYDERKFLEKFFITKEIFGFTKSQIKQMLIKQPKVWMAGARVLKERFEVVHNVMGISQERIAENPEVLLKRTFQLKERHDYLVYLNRAQYDPTKPNFVSLQDIATTTDPEFCKLCAKTSVDQYNEFLKTK